MEYNKTPKSEMKGAMVVHSQEQHIANDVIICVTKKNKNKLMSGIS